MKQLLKIGCCGVKLNKPFVVYPVVYFVNFQKLIAQFSQLKLAGDLNIIKKLYYRMPEHEKSMLCREAKFTKQSEQEYKSKLFIIAKKSKHKCGKTYYDHF